MIPVQFAEEGRDEREYQMDAKSRHWNCVPCTYGRGKRVMKWDTWPWQAYEYSYGIYGTGKEGIK